VEIAKSVGFNSPQLAALRLNLSLIDTPWLAAGNFITFMIKKIASIYTITIVIFGFFALALAEKSAELYLPIGRSPGLSDKFNLTGTIAEVSSQDQTLTVMTGASGTDTVTITEYTLIFLDKSKLRQPNQYGTFSDIKAGMLIEVRFEADKRHRPAEWIKLQIDK
jgi:hypothetical protein